MAPNRLVVFALFLLAARFGTAAPVAEKRFDLTSLRKIVRVSDPQISPDGTHVVISVSRPNYEENRHDAQLVLVEVATGFQQALTSERRGVNSPRWSASGDRLAFLATGTGGKPQIFVLPMNGGDASQVTRTPNGVQQFAWRPDGKAFAYATSDEATKKTGEERFNDSFEVGNDDFLVTAAPMATHIWIIGDKGGEPKRLTSGAWSIPVSRPPSSPASPLSWSPDGKSIAYVKVASPHSGDGDLSSLRILDVAASTSRAVTGRERYEGYPSFSPDGRWLTYWFPHEGKTKNGNEIYLAPVAGGEGRSLTAELDRNVMRAIWMPDGKSVLAGANDHTSVALWTVPVDGKPRKLDLGKITPVAPFWLDASIGPHGEIAFSGSEPQRPTELYFMASAASKPKRLTGFNDEIAALELGRTESMNWKGPDNFPLDGVVTFPPGFDSGKTYPLVLFVHGGPRSASKETFSPRAQLMAAQGWAVFEPNYRGSDNLGNAFQSAIWNDAGDGPGRDVMSGVEMLKKAGWVDQSKIAVTGWSYGGYMTTWLLGHYPGWKAAVAGAAVTDWLDQYDLGDANVRRGSAFGGSPWTDNRIGAYVAQSPITYANKIHAPTLILSDTGDARVTVTQSFKLYHALKDNGVPVKFVLYPIPGHSPADPVRARDVDRRWIDWLAQYLN